jgi:hypothetical protein
MLGTQPRSFDRHAYEGTSNMQLQTIERNPIK